MIFCGRPSSNVSSPAFASPIAEGFAAGRQMKIPLIIGGNSNEASLFRPQPAQHGEVVEEEAHALAVLAREAPGQSPCHADVAVVVDHLAKYIPLFQCQAILRVRRRLKKPDMVKCAA